MPKIYHALLFAILLVCLDSVNHQLPQTQLYSPGSVDEECPDVVIVCRNCDSAEDKLLIFNVKVSGVKKDKKLKYEWRVIDGGEIKSGQGTSSITVEAKRDGKGMGVLVKIEGIPGRCGDAVYYTYHY